MSAKNVDTTGIERILLSESEVSKLTGLGVTTLQQWRVRKMGPPYHKLGGAVRYRREDIDLWLERSRVDNGGEAA